MNYKKGINDETSSENIRAFAESIAIIEAISNIPDGVIKRRPPA